MTVALVGSGPAVAAVRAAIADTDHDIAETPPDGIAGHPLAVVVAESGSDAFATANATARDAGTAWVGVELGGVGGHPVVSASVATFGPDGPCYDCLVSRVAANADPDPESVDAPDAPTARLAGAHAGREAVRLLAGATGTGSLLELPHAERRVLPVPDCSCAPERDWALPTDYATRPLEAALAAAQGGLDERVGLVNAVGEAESFPVPYYLANLSDTSGFSDVRAGPQAAGVSPDWNAAFMKALGEGLERYCAGVYRRDALPVAAPGEVPDAVGPDRFVLPEGTDTDGRRRWLPATELGTGERVHVPASRALFPYESSEPTITTGLGLGNSGAEALVSGLTEVVERDAAILAWYSTFEPLGLAVEDEAYATIVKHAKAEDLTVTATLLTQDVDVPVVGVAVHREEWPRFAMGLACDLDAGRAARSAAAEAVQNWTELRGMGERDAMDAGGRIGHFASHPDAASAFTDPETTVPAGSVGEDVAPEAALDTLVERVGEAGLDAYGVRLTTPDVAALGFEAVRVLVPAAQPLFVGDAYFGERAERVPESLGYEPRLRREHHPYP